MKAEGWRAQGVNGIRVRIPLDGKSAAKKLQCSLYRCTSSKEVKVKAVSLLAAMCVLQLCACSNQDDATRAKIAEAAVTGRQAAQAVEKYINKHGRIPAQLEDAYVRPTALRDIRLMSVNRQTGVVRVTLSFPPVEGKSLLFVRSRNPDKRIVWRCTSEDIHPKYLPEACRS